MYCRSAEVVAVGDAAEGNAVRARVLDRLVYRQRSGFKCEAVVGVHQAGATVGANDPWDGFAVRASMAQMRGVMRDARNPMTREPILFRGNERMRSRRRHCLRRAGCRKRPSDKIGKPISRDFHVFLLRRRS